MAPLWHMSDFMIENILDEKYWVEEATAIRLVKKQD